MGRNIETVKASLLLTFVFCPNVDKTKTIRQSARCLFWSFWFGNGRKMATTACFSGYTPQLIKALLFEAVFKRLSEASLRLAALAGSIFIDWSFSDKIFVSRRNFLKTIRSPVESVWERNPLASTAFCGFSSSALITADNLPGRVLCVAKQQDHLGSLSFGHSCAGIPNISFWILIWLLWCEPDMNVYSLSSSEKTCSFCDIFHRVSTTFSLYYISYFSRHQMIFSLKLEASNCSALWYSRKLSWVAPS